MDRFDPFCADYLADPYPHLARARGIARIDVSVDADRLAAWLGGQELPVRVVDGPPGLRSVVIATEDGDLTLP